MRARLAAKAPVALVPVELCGAPAEVLPFADQSFDVVVSTLVLCTVADPAGALRRELPRASVPAGGWCSSSTSAAGDALPGGRNGSRRCGPRSRLLPPDRDTGAAIAGAGFDIGSLELFDEPEQPGRAAAHRRCGDPAGGQPPSQLPGQLPVAPETTTGMVSSSTSSAAQSGPAASSSGAAAPAGAWPLRRGGRGRSRAWSRGRGRPLRARSRSRCARPGTGTRGVAAADHWGLRPSAWAGG